ncbi:MAG: (d)CMP kinase [Pirellulaceae bacterium]
MTGRVMIVTIDGPAGAGKSSVARRLAQRLGFRFLDTGAMYRAVAWAAMRNKLIWEDRQAVADLAAHLPLEFQGSRVLLDGQDISDAIRTPEVTANTHFVADNPLVRAHLVELQRRLAHGNPVVTEGRDQGTVAFPQAECKFFLTASAEERARRRRQQLLAGGENVPLAEVLTQQELRDQRDTGRDVGPLVPAADAIHVLTDGMTLENVVAWLEQLVRQHAVRPESGRKRSG